MPGTVDDTADEVTRLGGAGVASPCDHADDDAVAALFARVEREHGRLDVLVNNAWGGHEVFDLAWYGRPFWEQPLGQWDAMFTRGVRHHLVASRHAAPLFVRQGRGLVVTTTFWDEGRYLAGNLLYDLAKSAMTRLAFGMAEELRPHGVASVAVSPGWMRTELVLAAHQADEARWRERPELARTESPRYLGRAVAALAADPDVLAKSGGVCRVADLAAAYGFTDVDGRLVPPFEIPREPPATEPPAADEDAVGTVHAWLAAVNAGDVPGVLARTAPGVVLVGPRGAAVGHDALRAWLGHAGATFAARATYARADVVVVAQRAVWRDAAGAVRGAGDVATRFRVARGRVAEVERYDTPEAALAAAGLATADEVAAATDPAGPTDAAGHA